MLRERELERERGRGRERGFVCGFVMLWCLGAELSVRHGLQRFFVLPQLLA